MTSPRAHLNRSRLKPLVSTVALLAVLSGLSGCSGDSKSSSDPAESAPPTAEETAFCEVYVDLLRAQQTMTLKPKSNNTRELKALAARAHKLTRPESLSEGGFKTLQVQADFFARFDPLSAKGQKFFQKKLSELGPEAFGDLSTFTNAKCKTQLEELQLEASPAMPAATMSPASPATQDKKQR